MAENTPNNTGPNITQPPHPSELGGLPLSAAQYLRAKADDEHANLQAPSELPNDAAERIAFDRALRSACARSMGEIKCPDAVRAAITNALKKESVQEPVAHRFEHHEGVVRTRMGDTTSVSFWAGARRFAALAAVIALAAFVIFRSATSTSGGHVIPVQQASLLSAFVENEHDRCTGPAQPVTPCLKTCSEEEAYRNTAAALGAELTRLRDHFDSMRNAGFEFVGFGVCDAPGPGQSVHLLFRVTTTDPKPARVSLFIQNDSEHPDIRETESYHTGCPKKKATLIVWRTEGVVNYLYACTPEALKTARIALHVPDDEHPL